MSLEARFNQQAGAFHIETAVTESQLDNLLKRRATARIVHGRIRMPRIQIINQMYWPISERVSKLMFAMYNELLQRGISPDPFMESLTLEQVEGSDLSEFWAPIWFEHPASQTQAWPWGKARSGKSRARRVKPTKLEAQ
jgi:hypothetical protein